MNGNLLSRPQETGIAGRRRAYRRGSRIQAEDRAGSAGQDEFHARAAAGRRTSSGSALPSIATSPAASRAKKLSIPSKSVMVTSQRTEDASSGLIASGVPGTASNLPRPTSRPSTGNSGNSRRTENITYQSSRMVSTSQTAPGQHQAASRCRIILDQSVRFEKGQKIIEPPSPEKLKVVKDLAAGIVASNPTAAIR